MTREEAINWLKSISFVSDHHITEAIDMAIEALSADSVHDGCDGCRYEQNTEHEYPCKDCKQNYMDMWEQKPNDSLSVVRCKDCVQKHIGGSVTHYYWCDRWDMEVDDTDYCSWGERREP